MQSGWLKMGSWNNDHETRQNPAKPAKPDSIHGKLMAREKLTWRKSTGRIRAIGD
jgi:hypothetical protein